MGESLTKGSKGRPAPKRRAGKQKRHRERRARCTITYPTCPGAGTLYRATKSLRRIWSSAEQPAGRWVCEQPLREGFLGAPRPTAPGGKRGRLPGKGGCRARRCWVAAPRPRGPPIRSKMSAEKGEAGGQRLALRAGWGARAAVPPRGPSHPHRSQAQGRAGAGGLPPRLGGRGRRGTPPAELDPAGKPGRPGRGFMLPSGTPWDTSEAGAASSSGASPSKNSGWNHGVAGAPGRSCPGGRYRCSVSAGP